MRQRPNDGWSPLMRAADRGDAAEVDRLLRAGAHQDGPSRRLTPQRLAMRRGHISVLRLLQRGGSDEQQLERPPDGGPDTVVLRRYGARAYWIVLALVPSAIGLLIGEVWTSTSASYAGVILSAVAAVALLVVGVNALERFAFDGHRFWYRSIRRWQGPVDLRGLRAVHLVPSSSGARMYLLQDDAGVRIRARRSHGFDASQVVELDEAGSLHSLAMSVSTSTLHPGCWAEIARHAYAAGATVEDRARRLFDRALADEMVLLARDRDR